MFFLLGNYLTWPLLNRPIFFFAVLFLLALIALFLTALTIYLLMRYCYLLTGYSWRPRPKKFRTYEFWYGTRLGVFFAIPVLRFKSYLFVWRPYFKKDGYYGLFIENTLWK